MEKLAEKLQRAAWQPAIAIESVLSIFCIFAGVILLIFAGAYLSNGIINPSVFSDFDDFSGPLIFGVTYLGGGVLSLVGLRKGKSKVEEWGLLSSFFSLLLTWLLSILINGLLPLSWITVMFLSIISGIIYLHRRLAV